MDDDDIKEEGNGSIADSGGAGAVDESGNVDMEDSLNLDGCDSTIEAAANKGKKGPFNLLLLANKKGPRLHVRDTASFSIDQCLIFNFQLKGT